MAEGKPFRERLYSAGETLRTGGLSLVFGSKETPQKFRYVQPNPILKIMSDPAEHDRVVGFEHDERPYIVAEWLAEALRPRILESVADVQLKPTGYDLEDRGDRAEFTEAVIAGLQLAVEQASNIVVETTD